MYSFDALLGCNVEVLLNFLYIQWMLMGRTCLHCVSIKVRTFGIELITDLPTYYILCEYPTVYSNTYIIMS